MNVKTTIRKNVYGEYVCRMYIDGRLQKGSTYYTNDVNDANETCKDMERRAHENARGSHTHVDVMRDKFNARITSLVGDDSDIGDVFSYAYDIVMGTEQFNETTQEIFVRACMYSLSTEKLEGIMEHIRNARKQD